MVRVWHIIRAVQIWGVGTKLLPVLVPRHRPFSLRDERWGVTTQIRSGICVTQPKKAELVAGASEPAAKRQKLSKAPMLTPVTQ